MPRHYRLTNKTFEPSDLPGEIRSYYKEKNIEIAAVELSIKGKLPKLKIAKERGPADIWTVDVMTGRWKAVEISTPKRKAFLSSETPAIDRLKYWKDKGYNYLYLRQIDLFEGVWYPIDDPRDYLSVKIDDAIQNEELLQGNEVYLDILNPRLQSFGD